MKSSEFYDPFAVQEESSSNTANDEAIARALAESMASENTSLQPSAPPQQNITTRANCPGQHGLELFETSAALRVTCNACNRRLDGGSRCWSCVQCNYDSCESCYQSGNVAASRPRNASIQQPQTSSSFASSTPFGSNNPFAASSSHMAIVPCTIGAICIEMLVDTGAQTSVLSMPIVRQLGLTKRLDRRYMGIAAGVGQARISGKINNVICSFGVGHVEFPMDFIVLDIKDSLVILGLDQMRKYKVLVDLEHEKLIFGGRDGIEVNLLPANQTHTDFRGLSSGCILM